MQHVRNASVKFLNVYFFKLLLVRRRDFRRISEVTWQDMHKGRTDDEPRKEVVLKV